MWRILAPVLFLSGLLFARPIWAIDSFTISVGELVVDQHKLTQIEVNGALPPNREEIKASAGAKHLGKNYEINGVLKPDRWRAAINTNLGAEQISRLYQSVQQSAPDWQMSGQFNVNASAYGRYAVDTPVQLDYVVQANQLNIEYPEIGVASESLSIDISGKAIQKGEVTHADVEFHYKQGLFAYGDVLLEPVAGAINLKSDFRYYKDRLHINNASLHDPGGININISQAKISLSQPEAANASIRLDVKHLDHAYKFWAQPLLYGTLLEDLELAGELNAAVEIHQGVPGKANIIFNNIDVADKKSRFSIYDLNATYDGDTQLSQGKFSAKYTNAGLYGLLLGGSGFDFKIDDYNAVLMDGFSVPLYGGDLKVFELSFENINKEDFAITFNGVLTPVNLTSLTHDLGWQTFGGTLSGVIPSVRYKDRAMKLDGILLAKAFDGTFRIKDLYVGNFLGVAPSLSADFEVENIDLHKLTDTFDFGRMEGRLSGYVNALKMSAWQAESFDAFFYTPENDDSRHVISQRAVDNLTSLSGSDITSVLSRTYLRFLENFRYEKLGIGCTLKNNVCRMRGIEPAGGSAYYIVKSGWMPPRLDIVGYSQDVDWADLVGRLERVLSDNAPVIQ